MTILVSTETAFDKTQHLFMIKKKKNQLTKNRGDFLNLIKGIYGQFIAKVLLNGKILNIFFPRIKKMARIFTLIFI